MFICTQPDRIMYTPFLAADGAGSGAGGSTQTSGETGSTATEPQTGGDPGSSTSSGQDAGGAPAATAGTDKTPDAEKKFTQADLDAQVKARLAEEKRREEGRQTTAKRKADDEALAAQQKWQELAESRGTEIESLKAQLAGRDHDTLKMRIATKHKLPEELAEVLKGDDETAIEEHAKKLAKLVTAPKAPDTEAGRQNHTKPGAGADKPGASGTAAPQQFAWQSSSDVKW